MRHWTRYECLVDFIQLLFVCQQWRVFRYERNPRDVEYMRAGEGSVHGSEETKGWNFVVSKRHWLDQIHYGLYMHGAWIVLSIVYLSGTTRISLLGLGYLIASFYFFWYGQDFLIKPISTLLNLYDFSLSLSLPPFLDGVRSSSVDGMP